MALKSYRPDVTDKPDGKRWENHYWVTSYHANEIITPTHKRTYVGAKDYDFESDLDFAYRWSLFTMYWPAISIYALVGTE